MNYFFRCEIRRTSDLIWYRNFFPKNEYKIGFITGLNQGKVFTIFSIFPQMISEIEKSFNENKSCELTRSYAHIENIEQVIDF